MSEPKSDTTKGKRREPTGMNIYGETMAEYYQRRTNERGSVIERSREAFMDLTDALADEHGGDHHDGECEVCVAIVKLREALRDVGQKQEII